MTLTTQTCWLEDEMFALSVVQSPESTGSRCFSTLCQHRWGHAALAALGLAAVLDLLRLGYAFMREDEMQNVFLV